MIVCHNTVQTVYDRCHNFKVPFCRSLLKSRNKVFEFFRRNRVTSAEPRARVARASPFSARVLNTYIIPESLDLYLDEKGVPTQHQISVKMQKGMYKAAERFCAE
jgi:hypothetical protein